MDAITKFKEAAAALQQDEVYKNYQAAREAYEGDAELQEKLGEFRLARLNIDNEAAKPAGEKDEAKIAELNTLVNKLYSEVLYAPKTEALTAARGEVEAFVQYVNAILNTAIDGGDPMQAEAPESGCPSGGCSSCSGCR